MKISLSLLSLTLLVLFVARCAPTQAKASAPPPLGAQSPQRELLIAFKSSEAAAARAALFKKHDLREIQKVGTSDLYLVEVNGARAVKDVQALVQKEEGVKYAEPNSRMKTF